VAAEAAWAAPKPDAEGRSGGRAHEAEDAGEYEEAGEEGLALRIRG